MGKRVITDEALEALAGTEAQKDAFIIKFGSYAIPNEQGWALPRGSFTGYGAVPSYVPHQNPYLSPQAIPHIQGQATPVLVPQSYATPYQVPMAVPFVQGQGTPYAVPYTYAIPNAVPTKEGKEGYERPIAVPGLTPDIQVNPTPPQVVEGYAVPEPFEVPTLPTEEFKMSDKKAEKMNPTKKDAEDTKKESK